MSLFKNTPAVAGLVVSTLAGALLGAIISWIFLAPRNADEREKPPNVMEYIQLLVAIFILAKQVGDVVRRRMLVN